MSAVIRVSGLSKGFKRYHRPRDRLLELLTGRCRHTRYRALEDISFEVQQGETLGVLGRNGAGKSTLLKLLNGVLLPDAGSSQCDGSITGLLELGTGFDMHQTGRQNIETNGLLIGMSLAQIRAAESAIIDFSELGDAIEQPVRTYSSGMVMRLAFSIAIHAEPRCFLVDEALSVGDGHFQQKCMARIRAFRDQGGAILFVSHDLNAVKVLCDRAIVLDGGRIALDGTPDEAVNLYNQLMGGEDAEVQSSGRGFGSGEVVITEAAIEGCVSGAATVSAGETTRLSFTLQARETVTDLTLGIMLRDRFGQDIYGTNSHHQGAELSVQAGETLRLSFDIDMAIAPGKYTLTAALHAQDNHIEGCYHWCDNLLGFEVAGFQGKAFSGLCALPSQLTVGTMAGSDNSRTADNSRDQVEASSRASTGAIPR